MDSFSESNQQAEKLAEEPYQEEAYPSRQARKQGLEASSYPSRQARKQAEEKGSRQWLPGRGNKKPDEETRAGEYSSSRSQSSKKKLKVEIPRGKLVFKILAVAAVLLNFNYLLSFMNQPTGTFTHTLTIVGVCIGINFLAVWLLFYKSSFMRFYLAVAALLGAFGYYFYVNYTNQSFLGNNLIPSVLVILSAFMAINPKVHYYLKSLALLVIPVLGVYFSGNRFALVWTLMFNAGLILFFRVKVSKPKKLKTNKWGVRTSRDKEQSV